MTTLRLTPLAVAIIVWTASSALAQDKGKTEAAKLASESRAALQTLSAEVPLAKELGKTAVAILVFPSVTKAGLGIGGQYGEGTLLKSGAPVAYYKTTGASFGLQAGGQNYGYAMFFMNAGAVAGLDAAKGFEVGVGPSIVMVDEGMGEEHDDPDPQERRLRVHLLAEGPDGRPWHPGQQDHEDHAEVTLQQCPSGHASTSTPKGRLRVNASAVAGGAALTSMISRQEPQ